MATVTRTSKAGGHRVGDRIVYIEPKCGECPGPRAEHIHPAAHGDDYGYTVAKYWIVSDIVDEHTIVAKTRTGKTHRVSVEDPCLRRATLFDLLLHRHSFPSPDTPETGETDDLT